MNQYNPMLDYQRNQLLARQSLIQSQLSQLDQQMRQPSFNPYPQPSQPSFRTQPVGSIDEAKAYPVEPSVLYLFPDSGTGKIYLKKMNMDNGKSELIVYTPEPLEGESEPVKSDPFEAINARLNNIDIKLGGLYESISSSAKGKSNSSKSDGRNATADGGKNATAEPSTV